MGQNELLKALTQELAGRKPDWHKVVERFKRSSMYQRGYEENNLASRLSEISLRVLLEDLSSDIPGRIVFDPIKNGEHAGRFKFMHVDGTLHVREDDDRDWYSEIDELALIDKLPVLFEVKLSRYHYKGPKPSAGGRGVAYAMKKERVAYLMRPLRRYFKSNCGYVLVMPHNQINLRSSVQRQFEDDGGIMVPFYADRRSWREEVKEIRRVYNL